MNKEYSYGGAPQSAGLNLRGNSTGRRDFEKGLLYALAFPKLGDSLPALVGALCGALTDHAEPAVLDWVLFIQELSGICLPQLAGVDYLAVVEQIIDLGETMGGHL